MDVSVVVAAVETAIQYGFGGILKMELYFHDFVVAAAGKLRLMVILAI